MKYISILAIILLASCKGSETTEQQKPEMADGNIVTLTAQQLKNAGIETGIAAHKNIQAVIRATGQVDVPPQNMVSVSFPLGGYLKSTHLLQGMHVRKGEVIAIMEDPQYIQLQQDYLTAKARETYLENEYNRQKELNTNKASSDKTFQQAEAEYKSNRILISGLRQKLQLIGINPDRLSENNISRSVNIHAPIDGFVATVNVNIGKYVTPSDVLFELVNPTDIHLMLTIFEKDINAVYVGQKLVAYTNSDPEKKYPCEVILVGKDVNAERAIQVHCHFSQYDKALVPGMFMNAEIETNNTSAYVLPEEAVVRYNNKQYIFIALPGNQYKMQEVQTGIAGEGLVSIINYNDINMEQQKVVTKNAYTLLMKLKNTAE